MERKVRNISSKNSRPAAQASTMSSSHAKIAHPIHYDINANPIANKLHRKAFHRRKLKHRTHR